MPTCWPSECRRARCELALTRQETAAGKWLVRKRVCLRDKGTRQFTLRALVERPAG